MINNERNVCNTGTNKYVVRWVLEHCIPSFLTSTVKNAFHQNLQQLRETAPVNGSILSPPYNENRDSTYSIGDGNTSASTYDSHTPLMQNAEYKGSGLKYMQDDGSDDDGLLMLQPER